LRERALIWSKWLGSAFTDGRRLEDYPTHIRPNGEGSDPEQAYSAQILNWPGPVGLGGTPEDAMASLGRAWRESLEGIRTYRLSQQEEMPRPGSKVPLRFAPSVRVALDPELLNEFIEKVLGFPPGAPVFISDGSRLSDFGDDEHERQPLRRIQDLYGLDVSAPP
jgi:predicted RNase H-like HicB family nuclease